MTRKTTSTSFSHPIPISTGPISNTSCFCTEVSLSQSPQAFASLIYVTSSQVIPDRYSLASLRKILMADALIHKDKHPKLQTNPRFGTEYEPHPWPVRKRPSLHRSMALAQAHSLFGGRRTQKKWEINSGNEMRTQVCSMEGQESWTVIELDGDLKEGSTRILFCKASPDYITHRISSVGKNYILGAASR